jgi:hypothetical protein
MILARPPIRMLHTALKAHITTAQVAAAISNMSSTRRTPANTLKRTTMHSMLSILTTT